MRGKRGKAPSLDQTHDLAVRPGHIRIAALQEAPLRGMLILRAFPDEAVEYHIDLHDRKMRFRARRSVLTHSAEKVMREARSALTDSDRAHQIFIWRQFFRQTVSA